MREAFRDRAVLFCVRARGGAVMAALIVVAFVLFILISPLATAQRVNYETYTGWAVPEEPVLPEREVRPSLWFRADQIDALREKKHADAYSRRLWALIRESDHLTEALPPTVSASDERRVIHQYYGTISKRAKYNALLSLLADAEEERQTYRRRAIDALNRAYDGPIYELDPRVPSSPVDEIYRGTWAQNFAAAYDWVQPHLSPQEDRAIRARLVREADLIAANLHAWAPRPHNHLSKPAWGLGSLALALAEEPNAERWLREALKAANQNTRYFFSEDGIYREGSQYLVFSWINFVPFLYHYRNVSGEDHFPYFQPAFEWVIAARNGRGWLPNLEDSWIRPGPTHMVAPAYREARTRFHSTEPLANLLQWNFVNTDFGPFERERASSGFNYTGASWDYTLEIDEFLTYDPSIEPVAPDSSPNVFLDGGQTILRSDWSFADTGHRYLLFHGVAEADNHNHHDHLSFVIHARDQMMASDSGYSRESFGEPIRLRWYATPEAHNTITVDGWPARDYEENQTPPARYRIDTPAFAFEEKEAFFALGQVWRRAIGLVGKDYFFVADTLDGPEERPIELYLHGGRGEMKGVGNRKRSWMYEDDEYGRAARLTAWIFGEEIRLEDRSGEVSYIKGDYAAYGYVAARTRGKGATFLQLLFPLAPDEADPIVTDLGRGETVGAQLAKGGSTDTLLLRREAGPLEGGGLSAWGALAVLRAGDEGPAWLMVEGTELRANGALLVGASVPVTASGASDGDRLRVVIHGPDEPYEVSVAAPPGSGVVRGTFAGAGIELEEREGTLTARLRGSGELVLQR